MSMTANENQYQDLDNETPSTIKEGFQRWLIVAGVLFTLLFLYLFISLSREDEDTLSKKESTDSVPQQVQEATRVRSDSLELFQESIRSNQQDHYGEKIQLTSMNEAFAPRNTTPNTRIEQYVAQKPSISESLQKKPTEMKTPYEQLIESEKLRAYRSIASKGNIGDDSAFYDRKSQGDSNQQAASKNNPQGEVSIEARQQQIKQKIKNIAEYRLAVEEGRIAPGTLPIGLHELSEATR